MAFLINPLRSSQPMRTAASVLPIVARSVVGSRSLLAPRLISSSFPTFRASSSSSSSFSSSTPSSSNTTLNSVRYEKPLATDLSNSSQAPSDTSATLASEPVSPMHERSGLGEFWPKNTLAKPPNPIVKKSNADHLIPSERYEDAQTSDKWWLGSEVSGQRIGHPGNQYTGRSIPSRYNDYSTAYRKLMGMMSRASIRKELRIAEFYEKPSDRKRRVASERHRRRFKEEVRNRVQLVQMLRSRK